MKIMRWIIIGLISITFILSGCNAADSQTKEVDYEQTKKMVVDILKTDEGKKAVQDLMTDEKMKQQLIMDAEIVKQSIMEVITSEDGIQMWKKLFDDSEFVKKYTEALDGEQKKLFKGLMHDAEFQKQMLELLQNPEISEQTLTLLKSQQFRAHLEETIGQTLDSPLYKAKIEEILLKAAEKKKKEDAKESGGDDKASK